MSAIIRKDGNSLKESRETLGDLLYADTARRRVPESEWAALVSSMAAGDAGALRALYERSHRLVFTLALRICGNRQTAEEVTVDVFHDLWRRAAAYDANAAPVLAWILNAARSKGIDRLRHEQRKKRVDPHPNHAPESAVQGDAGEAIQQSQVGQLLRRALVLLTADERTAIKVAFFSDLTYAEVAARLDQPLGTIKTRIRSGLDKLRRALDREELQP